MLAVSPECPEDAPAIAEVHVRSWQTGYAEIMPPEVLARLNVAAWAQRRRDLGTAEPDHPFRTLVARADDETVLGFATVGPYRTDQDPDRLDHRYAEILGLYVRPGYWGTGVGRRLLAASVGELTALGWTELRLWILADNRRARRFYERAGLVADGERATYELQRSGGRPPLGLVELRYAARLGELAGPPDR
ncbi:N-acetyltransferase [Plantactinospora sp. BC1]|nr:N-acetyltransferase [Plantactinospora sp. BC1]AVT41472.1 N-acetyltransferase [Plantactinospora sp. BB1]